MELSQRSILIKELINEQVDMGTFGLVELALHEFDKQNKEQIDALIECRKALSSNGSDVCMQAYESADQAIDNALNK